MTIAEMHISFDQKLDKISSNQAPAFEQQEVDDILTSAQLKVVKTRYSGINAKRQAFEQSQKRIDDLRTLVSNKNYNLVNSDYNIQKGTYNVNLTKLNITDYLFTLKDYLVVKDNNCNKTTNVEIKYIQHDKYSPAKASPFNKPTIEYPLKLVDKDFVELDFGGQISLTTYNITYRFTYLAYPQDIVFSNSTYTTLPNHMAEEVVNEAVSIALERITEPRQQTFTKELITQE